MHGQCKVQDPPFQAWFCMLRAMVISNNLSYMIRMDSANCRIHNLSHGAAWTVQIVGSTISAMVLHGQCNV